MSNWLNALRRVESLEDLDFDEALVHKMENALAEQAQLRDSAMHFYTPTFKYFHSSEIASCGTNAWPAVSITGGDCKLQCDHCKAKILEPMIPARSPQVLWDTVSQLVENGAKGMLLTGGSNHRNEVEYDDYYSTIRRIKDNYPEFKIALHTALVTDDVARSMEQSGIDVAMMDVIGAQETITQVYHLKRKVEDFEATLESLVKTRMKVVPHIVIGLHYGKLLGEWRALEMLQKHRPDALVLVVVMPQYAPEKRPFVTPNVSEVGEFFLDARRALPDLPILLGCARPAGLTKTKIDSYAVMTGVSGIAHPADGVVELAARLGRKVKVSPSCCSIAVGEEVMGMDDNTGLELDLDKILAHERSQPRSFPSPRASLSKIKVVTL